MSYSTPFSIGQM